MNLVALETATSVCSVALLQNDRLTVELSLDRPRAHAENLVSMIGDALRYGGIDAAEIDAVAVSAGPGSYTGLRIGVSTAKGLAAAVGADLVSVPSLEALAARLEAIRPGDLVGAAFDARRDEAYVALFEIRDDGKLGQAGETVALRNPEIVGWLLEMRGSLWLVGSGWSKMTAALHDAGVDFTYLPEVRPSAVSVAREAAVKLESGRTEDLVTFEPYYLKEFVAGKPAATPFEKLSF